MLLRSRQIKSSDVPVEKLNRSRACGDSPLMCTCSLLPQKGPTLLAIKLNVSQLLHSNYRCSDLDLHQAESTLLATAGCGEPAIFHLFLNRCHDLDHVPISQGSSPGADPGFSFRGGGGGRQKILCPHAHYERGTELTFGRGPGPA